MSAVEVGVLVALGIAVGGLTMLAVLGRRGGGAVATPEPSGEWVAPDDFRERALDRLVAVAVTVTGASAGALFARAEERVGGATEVTSSGEGGGLLGVASVVLRSGRPALVAEGRGAAAVPVMWRGAQDAVLVVAGDRAGRGFDGADLEMLFEIAGWCGSALDHRSLHGASLDSTELQARALQTAAAVWDGTEPVRGDGLGGLARALGERLGLRGAELVELELAARLHDVGKLRVPGDVLRRRGPLTEEDFARVRLHPAWGAELVSRVPGLEAVAALVSLHHERVDGEGYPHALPGGRIPLGARILAVTDAYGALRTERPYRAALSAERAMEELRAATGQFDPEVVDALEEHLARAPSYV